MIRSQLIQTQDELSVQVEANNRLCEKMKEDNEKAKV